MDFFLLIGIILGLISVVVGMIVRCQCGRFDQSGSRDHHFRWCDRSRYQFISQQ